MLRYNELAIRLDLCDRKTKVEQLRNIVREEASKVRSGGVCRA